jgi:hypothetical protein
VAGDDAVPEERLVHARVAIRDEGVEFHERVGIEQKRESFARGQFAAGVLLIDAFLSPAEISLLAHCIQTR